jgi:hypothetical protein
MGKQQAASYLSDPLLSTSHDDDDDSRWTAWVSDLQSVLWWRWVRAIQYEMG